MWDRVAGWSGALTPILQHSSADTARQFTTTVLLLWEPRGFFFFPQPQTAGSQPLVDAPLPPQREPPPPLEPRAPKAAPPL